MLIAAGALPEGFSDEPVYTLNGAEYLDEETKWAWAYGAASLEEIVEARDAMRFVYFDLALPELSKAMKDPERTKEIGDANADGSWSFQPGGVLPNSVWKQDGKVFLSVLTEEQHPSICEVRREFLWLDDRMRILEVAAFKKHVADKGPGYDHSECTPAEKLGIEGSD